MEKQAKTGRRSNLSIVPLAGAREKETKGIEKASFSLYNLCERP